MTWEKTLQLFVAQVLLETTVSLIFRFLRPDAIKLNFMLIFDYYIVLSNIIQFITFKHNIVVSLVSGSVFYDIYLRMSPV